MERSLDQRRSEPACTKVHISIMYLGVIQWYAVYLCDNLLLFYSHSFFFNLKLFFIDFNIQSCAGLSTQLRAVNAFFMY